MSLIILDNDRIKFIVILFIHPRWKINDIE